MVCKITFHVSETVENLESLSEEELRSKLKDLLIKEASHGDGRRILLVFDAVNQVCVCEFGLTSLSTIFQSYHDGVWL